MRPRALSVPPQLPPHEPDLAPEHKAAVLAALRWAWSEVDPKVLASGDEARITAALQVVLNERSNGERRAGWISDFETVSRDESQRTADGRLNKKPDLTFRPQVYPRVIHAERWGWFVECKIIDGSALLRSYREDGVRRFAEGEYAAWMSSGVMLGYVRDGSLPGSMLKPLLHGYVGTRHVRRRAGSDEAESEHDRSKLARPCADITLIHVWLPAP